MTDPARPPSLSQRGLWAAQDWTYAAALQARSLRASGAEHYATGPGRPIIAVPGVYETWHFMRPLMDAVHERGHPIHVVSELKYNLRPVPESARVVMELAKRKRLTNVILLAHSKGGLIGKYAMTHLDDACRIDRMIAIATPFSGSDYARFAPLRHLRSFRATDPVLAALQRELDVNRRITSIYGLFDTLIPGGSELAGATNRQLPVGGHFAILGDPRTRQAVVDEVERAS